MRQRTIKTVVTFSTNSDALAMEAVAREYAVPGRIIPVPSDIDAGCGLAWCVSADDRATLMQALAHHALAYEGVFETMLY